MQWKSSHCGDRNKEKIVEDRSRLTLNVGQGFLFDN